MATPETWERRTLGEMTEVITKGTTPKTYGMDYTTSGIPFLRVENITKAGTISLEGVKYVSVDTHEALKRSQARPGDVLFSIAGALGRVAVVPKSLPQANMNQAVSLVRLRNDACDTDYLRHALHGPHVAGQVGLAKAALAQANLNLKQVGSLEVLLPPLPEQRKIAAILSSVDEAIEATQAVIDQVQVVKKGLMQELLTKGLPGRHKKFKPLSSDWRVGRVDHGRAQEIPEAWELVTLTDVARLESGHTPSRRRPDYWQGDIPWISLHDSKSLDGPEISETAQTIGPLGLANSSARMLPAGTVVFSRTATVGKAAVMGREMSTSQDFANYVCGDRLHNRYLMHLFRHMQAEWSRLMAGSTHKTIYMPVFKELQVLLPPVEEQKRIAQIADGFDLRLSEQLREKEQLQRLKAGLMSVLLTGELRVQPEPVE